MARNYISCNMATTKSRSTCYTSLSSKTSRSFQNSSTYNIVGRFKKFSDLKSPYLAGVYVNSSFGVTDKNKKGTNITSYALANATHKANPGDIKATNNKIGKNSVNLSTNDQAPLSKSSMDNDMNHSEYFNRGDSCKNSKQSNRAVNKKYRGHGFVNDFVLDICDKGSDYYNSPLKIDLEYSSTDDKLASLIKSNGHQEGNMHPSDVWEALRDINRFQFKPSPPLTEDSYVSPKRKRRKSTKRRKIRRNDTREFKTSHPEELSYVSSYELHSRSPCSFSSLDIITVIDKKDDLAKMSNEFETEIMSTNFVEDANTINETQIYNKTYNNNKSYNTKYHPEKAKTITYTKQINTSGLKYSLRREASNNIKSKESNKSIKNIANQGYYHSNEINQRKKYINGHSPTHSSAWDEIFYSASSGSSKELLYNDLMTNKNRRDKNKLLRVHILDDLKDISGKPKLRLNREEIQPNKHELLKNNHPEAITPSHVILPKFNKTNIKNMICKCNYPIVILGKNEITDTGFDVIHEEAQQFNGLNEKVWAYMQEWYGVKNNTLESSLKMKTKLGSSNAQYKQMKHEIVERCMILKNNKLSLGKQLISRDNQPVSGYKCIANKKRVSPANNIVSQVKGPRKIGPKQQLRDGTLVRLLDKNSTMWSKVDESTQTENSYLWHIKIISNSRKSNIVYTQVTNTVNPPKQKYVSKEKHPWSKTKWTNKFIEKVLRNIKNGVYYTNLEASNKIYDSGSEEVEMRTFLSCANSHNDIRLNSKYTAKKKSNALISIPGFDNPLPPLEIEALNAKEIAIKHCIRNIIISFDVTVPTKPVHRMKQASTLIPLEITESHTKVYKCKTAIFNATLPAELCSILPKILHNINRANFEHENFLPIPPIPIDKSDSLVSTLSDTPCEGLETVKYSIILRITMSSKLRRLLNGRYLNVDLKLTKDIRKLAPNVKYQSGLIEGLSPHLSRRHLFNYEVEPTILLLEKSKENIEPSLTVKKSMNTCTVLVPYGEHKVNTYPMLEKITNFLNTGPKIINKLLNNVFSINLSTNLPDIQDNNAVELSGEKFCMDVSFQAFTNAMCYVKKYNFFPNKAIEAPPKRVEDIDTLNNIDKLRSYEGAMNKQVKRKGFMVQRYRKCKTAFNLTRKNTTPLSKITKLDELFQALGAEKSLSNVFDNSCSGHKIMSYIEEIKNWTAKICPKQALLLVLLSNKQETPNMLRYRSILLQGISDNRINTVDELEKEINVIENKRFRINNFENGIPHLPTFAEQDRLYEELCCIAETTASENGRPLDESSKMHLKTLLEKRRLNPSYLRVLARYVGLGLLITPGKG